MDNKIKAMIYDGNFLRDVAEKLLEKGYRVIAPIKSGNYFIFREIDNPERISLNFINTKKSAKEFLFPQNEGLIRYREWIEEILLDSKKRAIIGIRPCDAKAITLLDEVFLKGFKDPYYEARRKNTIIIGYACNETGDYCFCSSLGLSPHETEGMDILVTNLGDRNYLEVITDKGDEIIGLFDVKEVTDEDGKRKHELERKAVESTTRKIVSDMKDVLVNNFNSDYWRKVAFNCIGCGTCTFLCPTCFCFDMLDEGEKEGIRYRAWDSCQFPLYTLESSSHNPRREKWQRLRNRFYDKFLYTVESKGKVFCVGCGRCISDCPAGVDITEVMNGLLKEVSE
jgi:ferredoxin